MCWFNKLIFCMVKSDLYDKYIYVCLNNVKYEIFVYCMIFY